MELSPQYRARRFRTHERDSIELAMKTRQTRSLAMLIDTAIESHQKAVEAEQEAARESQSRH
ncbi:hypothetical protein [Sphingomonas arenae]|uniref:hypothetical protein n=1 Tax=Sphingomonas arenae TaxID=2812555 RepID=UPI001967E63A|nr:hypothetical protein [Sphingomonas arenae]